LGAAATALTFEMVTSREGAERWAETAWLGFDSSSGAPPSFVSLVQGLRCAEGCFLLLAKRDGAPVGTALLTQEGVGVGVYYFATTPQERKKGVGGGMMDEILRFASRRVVTLQATPAGAPFYATHGFEPLFELPLHSHALEVF
jgi:GNAT superfamily N-acetyltransferase